jgi:hypothetical protein
LGDELVDVLECGGHVPGGDETIRVEFRSDVGVCGFEPGEEVASEIGMGVEPVPVLFDPSGVAEAGRVASEVALVFEDEVKGT